MTAADISIVTNDFDTLGGRLGRARIAKDLPLNEVAVLAGVKEKTLKAWECDRAEPRSNRLAMLAGILGVSPSWLLFGRGASPTEESTPANVDVVKLQFELDELKSEREKISATIEGIEESLRWAAPENSA